MSSAKWRPFCLGLNVLRPSSWSMEIMHRLIVIVYEINLKLYIGVLMCKFKSPNHMYLSSDIHGYRVHSTRNVWGTHAIKINIHKLHKKRKEKLIMIFFVAANFHFFYKSYAVTKLIRPPIFSICWYLNPHQILSWHFLSWRCCPVIFAEVEKSKLAITTSTFPAGGNHLQIPCLSI